MQVTPHGGLANRCTRPLCDLSLSVEHDTEVHLVPFDAIWLASEVASGLCLVSAPWTTDGTKGSTRVHRAAADGIAARLRMVLRGSDRLRALVIPAWPR